ncbi:hypothetical protein HAX54_032792, partial [Datura stramonium]|nr:hypothetical protein [Datura stramonium]
MSEIELNEEINANQGNKRVRRTAFFVPNALDIEIWCADRGAGDLRSGMVLEGKNDAANCARRMGERGFYEGLKHSKFTRFSEVEREFEKICRNNVDTEKVRDPDQKTSRSRYQPYSSSGTSSVRSGQGWSALSSQSFDRL